LFHKLFKTLVDTQDMPALIAHLNGNPNIGLYGFCTDKYVLVGKEVFPELAAKIGKALKVPVHRITIAGTSFIGVFLAGNSHALLVPSLIFDYELEALKKFKLPIQVMDTRLTCLGNNILCNDQGAIISPEFTQQEMQFIQKALKVPVQKAKLVSLDNLGSLAALNKRAALIHMDASEEDFQLIKKVLNLKAFPGTINLGNPYIKAGLLCNDQGYVVGEQSGGPEMVYLEQCLGFAGKVEDEW